MSAALIGWAAGACEPAFDDDAAVAVCQRGATRECEHASGCSAVETCSAPSQGYGACRCVELDAGLPAPAPAPLGGTCTKDAQCAAGAFCLGIEGHELLGGFTMEGVCAAACAQAEQACDAFQGSACVALEEASVCLDRCVPGAEGPKCGDRDGIVCQPLAEGQGYCRPLCTVHAECPNGYCDPRAGVCLTGDAPEQTDFGAVCMAEAASSCSGLCVAVGDSFAFCSHRCLFGSTADCSLTDGVRGACLIAAPGGGIGDVGYCAPLCDDDQECERFQRTCAFFDDAVLEVSFAARGACTGDVVEVVGGEDAH